MDNSPRQELIPAGRPQRIIEMRVSLEWLIGLAILLAGSGITMYVRGEKVSDNVIKLQSDVAELSVQVKTGNNQALSATGVQNLMTFRIDTIEADIRALKSKGKGN